MRKNDCTNIVERHPELESRTGIALHSVYASSEFFDEAYTIEVRGEARPVDGAELKRAVELVLSAFDGSERIIGNTTYWIDNENFYGFEVFDMSLLDLPGMPQRLRLTAKFA